MTDSATLAIIITGMIGFLGYVYQNILKTKLKTRYLRLFIRRKNWLIHDSVEDCLDSIQNKKILNSYFYRVNFIDYYVKKIVPFALSIGFVAVIFIAFTSEKLLDFKLRPTDSISQVAYMEKNGTLSNLESGQLIYISNSNEVFKVDIGTGEVLSFDTNRVITISSTMIILSFSFVIMLLLLASYFLNHASSEEFLGRLKEDIEHLEKESKIVDNLINEANDKHSEEYKKDRLSALEEKREYLRSLLESLKETKNELTSLN